MIIGWVFAVWTLVGSFSIEGQPHIGDWATVHWSQEECEQDRTEVLAHTQADVKVVSKCVPVTFTEFDEVTLDQSTDHAPP